MKKFLMEGKKVGGYVLLETVLAMIAFSMLSMAFFTIFSGQFSMINSSANAMQAQQYAEIDAQQLRLMNYYDLEDEGAKSRSAMTSWSNPDNLWEDEITIGNEIIIDDYTESKQRIATVKIYRKGDTLARFSMEVPLSSQNSGGGVPIGGIVAWGTDTNPQYDGGTYLECDGSTFDTNKYKRLYEVLGTNRVPDYRGMFLRGTGEQDYAQNNGYRKGVTTTKYGSNERKVGSIQGDATRRWMATTGSVYSNGNRGSGGDAGWGLDGTMWKNFDPDSVTYSTLCGSGQPYSNIDTTALATFPILVSGDNDVTDAIEEEAGSLQFDTSSLGSGWGEALIKYHYELKYDTSTDSEGNRFVSNVWLERTEEHPKLGFTSGSYIVVMGNELVMPVDNEVRPVNTAVKFMIKAK